MISFLSEFENHFAVGLLGRISVRTIGARHRGSSASSSAVAHRKTAEAEVGQHYDDDRTGDLRRASTRRHPTMGGC